MFAALLSEPAAIFVEVLVAFYEARGGSPYGPERVTQLEHALQCATLAEAEGASDELVAASLLHDLGHLNPVRRGGPEDADVDDRHEYRALHQLRRHYGEAVLGPIRLHVAAKRYLCGSRPGYLELLSPASRRSLEKQGGALTLEEARLFLRDPHARDAVRLRIWDDRAKIPGVKTPDLRHFSAHLLRCAL